MGWTVWIKVEDDDGTPIDPSSGWCAIGEAETRDSAINHAEDALLTLERNGFPVDDPLDGWRD